MWTWKAARVKLLLLLALINRRPEHVVHGAFFSDHERRRQRQREHHFHRRESQPEHSTRWKGRDAGNPDGEPHQPCVCERSGR